MTKISILIPIYNVENYLQRCIGSVLSQDFTDYELILVDDGSPDKCGEICDEYYTKYPDKIKVIHKDNGGLPSARLAGFKEAIGKYIMFLDSDDYLLPNALSILYNKIEEGYDIVKGINRRFYSDGSYNIERYKIINEDIIGSDNYISSIITYKVSPYLWGGLYRKEIIKEEDFIPLLDISVMEDFALNICIAKRVKKMTCIDVIVYAYFINNQSIMQTKVCSHNYYNRIDRILRNSIDCSNDNIKSMLEVNRATLLIKTFFTPEISFNHLYYKELFIILKDTGVYKYVKDIVDPKFLFFIKHKLLFMFYTRIYCLLFKSIRLSFRTRKIIY